MTVQPQNKLHQVYEAIAASGNWLRLSEIQALTGLESPALRCRLLTLRETQAIVAVNNPAGRGLLYGLPNWPVPKRSLKSGTSRPRRNSGPSEAEFQPSQEDFRRWRSVLVARLRLTPGLPLERVAVVCGFGKPNPIVRRLLNEMAKDGLIEQRVFAYGKKQQQQIIKIYLSQEPA